MIRAVLRDALTQLSMKVVQPGAPLVSMVPYPPAGLMQRTRPLVGKMSLTGLDGATTEMNVDGSATQTFYVEAHETRDRYITYLSWVLSGANAALNEFGTGPALTNGCLLQWRNTEGTVTASQAIKSNFDLVRGATPGGEPVPVGATTNVFRATNAISTAEAFVPAWSLAARVPPYGIKLDAGTSQRLEWLIRDDLTVGTNVVDFNCVVYGFERLPDSDFRNGT